MPRSHRARIRVSDLPWPTADVRPVADAIDVPASTLYEAIKRGDAPVATIAVGRRIKVLTRSVYELVGEPVPVTSGETASENRRSQGVGEDLTTSDVKCDEMPARAG